ncbi:hypothetical protein CVCC1112_2633 [Paenarthrobacter nicotinovorans]|uniref:hypothetical protein n=1 Tax=Paenarthrobacter nicotinovorans TaxID=29320 RepID=UPI0007CCF50F|nr:hypothetical protein [Paenarthrobacter nicotinovorans]GAT87974.1 hypothetical protein CVCC1112_2633 [Paenarthrobacter nicotinovorans]
MLTQTEAQANYAQAVGVEAAYCKEVGKAREKWARCAPEDADKYRAKLARAVAQHNAAIEAVTIARRVLHSEATARA